MLAIPKRGKLQSAISVMKSTFAMMSDYIVSARKYRPAAWDQVVGQEAITSTLQRSIENDQLAHAYLFCGPRGVGKTTCARIFAKSINGQDGEESFDLSFNVFELDAASNNSVDDIRQLTEQVRIPPSTGNYKVYIIDEVHMLSPAAFNAFLKTLEEPPPYAIFILATTEKHKILPTILSRCQIYDFNRIQVNAIVEHLKKIAEKESIKTDDEALHIIAEKADGALRDALSIFDQLNSFTDHNITEDAVKKSLNVLDRDYFFRFIDLFLEGNVHQSLIGYNEVIGRGFDGSHFLAGLATHLRDLLVAKDPSTHKLLQVSDETRQRYIDQSAKTRAGWIIKALSLIQQSESGYKQSRNQRLHVEVCLMKIASLLDAEKKKSEQDVKAPTATSASEPAPAKEKPSKPDERKAPIQQEANSYAEEPVTSPGVEEPPSTDTKQDENPEESKAEEKVSGGPTKPSSTPTGRARKSVFSIKGKLTPEKTEENEVSASDDTSQLPREPFSDPQLRVAITQFAEQMKEDGRVSVFTTLMRRKPVLEGTTIKLELDNAVQLEYLNDIREDLLLHLRSSLKNYDVQLETNIIESPDEPEAYTPVEQFKKMAEKNPSLLELKKRLDLDIDY